MYATGLAREARRAKALAMPAERAYEDMLNYMLNYIRKGSYACVVESQSRRAMHAHHVLYVPKPQATCEKLPQGQFGCRMVFPTGHPVDGRKHHSAARD